MAHRTTVHLPPDLEEYVISKGKGVIGSTNQKVIRQALRMHRLIHDDDALQKLLGSDFADVREKILDLVKD